LELIYVVLNLLLSVSILTFFNWSDKKAEYILYIERVLNIKFCFSYLKKMK
jgi:hypothetical protein